MDSGFVGLALELSSASTLFFVFMTFDFGEACLKKMLSFFTHNCLAYDNAEYAKFRVRATLPRARVKCLLGIIWPFLTALFCYCKFIYIQKQKGSRLWSV